MVLSMGVTMRAGWRLWFLLLGVAGLILWLTPVGSRLTAELKALSDRFLIWGLQVTSEFESESG